MNLEQVEEAWQVAPCGLVITESDGTIREMNATMRAMVGDQPASTSFQDLLSVGGRIYWETHLALLLSVEGRFDEVALELRGPEGRTQILVSAVAVPGSVLLAVSTARERIGYEQELLRSEARVRALQEETALLYQRSASVASELQHSLLPDLPPQDDRIAVAWTYRPGVVGLDVGGDWYDAFWSRPGVMSLVVGDVVGRGLPAAVAMGQLRSAVRALAVTGIGPAALLSQLDLFVEQAEGAAMATLVYAELDLSSGRCTYACAGHLPPVLLGTTPELMWEGRSSPLGASAHPVVRAQAEVQLAVGDGLVLYTDGLVERRSRGLDDGLERLVGALAALPDSPQEETLRDLVTTLLSDEDHADDVCLLITQWHGPGVRTGLNRSEPANEGLVSSDQ